MSFWSVVTTLVGLVLFGFSRMEGVLPNGSLIMLNVFLLSFLLSLPALPDFDELLSSLVATSGRPVGLFPLVLAPSSEATLLDDRPPSRLPSPNRSIDILDLPDEFLTGVEAPPLDPALEGSEPISTIGAIAGGRGSSGVTGAESTTAAGSVDEPGPRGVSGGEAAPSRDGPLGVWLTSERATGSLGGVTGDWMILDGSGVGSAVGIESGVAAGEEGNSEVTGKTGEAILTSSSTISRVGVDGTSEAS